MPSRPYLGCFTCRLRRKKCDEKHPSCTACLNLCVQCEYKRPMWWGIAEQRKIQKEQIKSRIKQTKMEERRGLHPGENSQVPCGRGSTLVSFAVAERKYDPYDASVSPDFSRAGFPGHFDIFPSHIPAPHLGYVSYAPYEVDVKTERHTFVNDVPMRHDSTVSTFSTFAPPHFDAPLPTFPEDHLFCDEDFVPVAGLGDVDRVGGVDPTPIDPAIAQTTSTIQASVDVSDQDQHLLDHFVCDVSRLVFPVLNLYQHGHTRNQMILRALETNKCYLHCCLSIAAIHLKTTKGLVGEQIDGDIMRHRYEAISRLCEALGQDTKHEEILDAALAMILFQCSVGPSDDYLPDIPWFDHFQAVSNLVTKLDLPSAELNSSNPYTLPPFSMTLTSWIDILGSTMIGKTPQFAHVYRSKHMQGAASGLRELTGCDDRVMYLISEIACLDALKSEGRIDDMTVCSHVSALGQQLEFTEPSDTTLESPYSLTENAIRPDILTKNMTTVFRIAARIYLCSLVPGFDRYQLSSLNLISAMADTLQCIPSGPNGFDRSLVWPLFITGVFSTPCCHFRTVLADRAASLGDHADLGSFGRMYRLLEELWRLNDKPASADLLTRSSGSPEISPSGSPTPKHERHSSLESTTSSDWSQRARRPNIHWRDVMQQNGWHYLLI